MDSTVKGSLIGACAVLAGIGLSEILTWVRANRQRQSEKTRLAGALAAELRALLARWDEMKPADGTALPNDIRWSAEENYFPLFDSAGERLLLLPRELAVETAVCYMRLKVLLDKMRLVNQHSVSRSAVPIPEGRRAADTAITLGLADAVKYAEVAVRTVNDLVEKLDAVSGELSLASRLWRFLGMPWRWSWTRLSAWRRRRVGSTHTG